MQNRGVLLVLLALLCGCAKHYRGDGMLLSTNRAGGTVTISHRDIQGYMPAMAMEFPVRQVPELPAGTRVSFRLAVRKQRAEITQITSRGSAAEFTAPAHVAVGAPIPDFTLLDQDSRPVSLSTFKGQVVVLNFIYTRCPQPDVCPRLSANFARLQRRFGSEVKLLSITMDPSYDTPEVLRRYAATWKANPGNWLFLTGREQQIRSVATVFGLVYFPEEGSMTHTARTAVIGRDGRLAGLVEGSGYAVSQLADLISRSLASANLVSTNREAP